MKPLTLHKSILFTAASFVLTISSMLAQFNKEFRVLKMDTSINNDREEIMPITSHDGKTLYFVRSLSPKNTGGKDAGQDVWMCERLTDTTWSRPINLGLPINNNENNAICGVSANGRTIYLTNIYYKKKMEPGISYSTKLDNGTWMQPIALKIPDMNVQRGYLGAYMCKSEKLLFLSYKGDNAIGREDLYVTEKKDDGTWTKPINLGNVVNSVGFELSPFYNEEDSTLYFASNGHEGLGDADIFKSKRLDGNSWTKWSKPQNLGTFFNGDGFDAYFYYNSADSTIYFSKEDPENNYTDIHFTHLRNLTEALRRIEEKKKPKIDSSLAANNTGLAATLAKEADEQRKAEEELNKRERIQIQDFDNVLFDFAKHDLRPEARKRLDKLYNFMVKNPSVGVEIIGHADSIDTELVNLILSVKRSEECKNYLINKGISKRRILTHGFGKQLPVATNRTEEGRQQNRRAEINILVDNKSKGKLEYMPKVMEAGGGGRK